MHAAQYVHINANGSHILNVYCTSLKELCRPHSVAKMSTSQLMLQEKGFMRSSVTRHRNYMMNKNLNLRLKPEKLGEIHVCMDRFHIHTF